VQREELKKKGVDEVDHGDPSNYDGEDKDRLHKRNIKGNDRYVTNMTLLKKRSRNDETRSKSPRTMTFVWTS